MLALLGDADASGRQQGLAFEPGVPTMCRIEPWLVLTAGGDADAQPAIEGRQQEVALSLVSSNGNANLGSCSNDAAWRKSLDSITNSPFSHLLSQAPQVP